jgi:hypothetical protein
MKAEDCVELYSFFQHVASLYLKCSKGQYEMQHPLVGEVRPHNCHHEFLEGCYADSQRLSQQVVTCHRSTLKARFHSRLQLTLRHGPTFLMSSLMLETCNHSKKH